MNALSVYSKNLQNMFYPNSSEKQAGKTQESKRTMADVASRFGIKKDSELSNAVLGISIGIFAGLAFFAAKTIVTGVMDYSNVTNSSEVSTFANGSSKPFSIDLTSILEKLNNSTDSIGLHKGYIEFQVFGQQEPLPMMLDTFAKENEFFDELTSKEQCMRPAAYLEMQGDDYKGIPKYAMNMGLGTQERSLSDEETRLFYNEVASANQRFAFRALEIASPNPKRAIESSLDSSAIAEMACETRHAARVTARKLGSYISEAFAKARDFGTYLNTEGLTCDQISEKYGHDPRKIIEKSGATNEFYNNLVKSKK